MAYDLFSPPHQRLLRNQTVRSFGYDTQNIVDYGFNDLGFRSPDLENRASLIFIGNSVTFGIGLPLSETYAHLVSQNTGMPYFNASFGCWSHENHDHLHNLDLLAHRSYDDVFVIQINNLDRRRVDNSVIRNNPPDYCVDRLVDFWHAARDCIGTKQCYWIYWDNVVYDIPKSIIQELTIYNNGHFDSSLSHRKDSFGPKSHRLISQILSRRLTKKS